MSNKEEMVKAVVARLFPGKDPSRCLENKLCDDYLCQTLAKCCVDQKSENQLKYVCTPTTRNVFLSACPGSGKTEVVGMKSAFEFRAWQFSHSGIAILTFTNNAADVIRERVEQYAGIKKSGHPHFVGTMDSWLHGYLANPFGDLLTSYQGQPRDNTKDKSIRVVEEDASGEWLRAFQCKTAYHFIDAKTKKPKSMPLFANHLQYNLEHCRWDIKIPGTRATKTDEEYYGSEGFGVFASDKNWLSIEYLRSGFSETKTRFVRAGFATYHDMECVSYTLLKRVVDIAKRVSLRFPIVIVDECQDLSWIQLQTLGILSKAGTMLHFVGDLNQAIYKFKQVTPEKAQRFISSRDFETQHLTDNFRSCQEIVDISSQLVPCQRSHGKETSPADGGPACVCVFYEENKLSIVPSWFEEYLEQRDIEIGKSAILARGHDSAVNALRRIQKPQTKSKLFPLAMALHLWSRNDASTRQDAIEQIGHFMASNYFNERHGTKLSYYCPESVVSAMQWRIWLARILDEISSNDSPLRDLAQTWSGWAKCVSTLLVEIVGRYRSLLPTILQENPARTRGSDGSDFRAPSGLSKERVVDCLTIPAPQPNRIRINTIHSVKGETFDAVLLVSWFKKGEGGHWSEWLKDPQSEHARFAYVASSRPKRILAWAIPMKGRPLNADLTQIDKLGFKILDVPMLQDPA
jgi:DNA helicase-2/ATP-dependent DNA helicase PcrA